MINIKLGSATAMKRRDILRAGAVAAIADTLGTVATAASNKKVIKIGILGPLTHFTGVDLVRAAEMAADEINAAGGIDGSQIVLVPADTEGEPGPAIRALQRLATSEKVTAIVGGFRSGAVLSLVPFMPRIKLPFIITGAASPAIMDKVSSDNGYKYLFRPWMNANFQAENTALVARDILAHQLKLNKVMIDAENFTWAHDYAEVLHKLLPTYGLTIVGEINHDPEITDFSPIFAKATQAGAEAIIPIISNDAGYTMVKQYAAQRPKFVLCGNNNASYLTSGFWKDTNGACAYEMSAVVRAPLTPKTLPFWDAFTKRFNKAPFYTSLATYDSVYLLKEAIEAHHSTAADDIVSALSKIRYTGTSGIISFDSHHEVISTPDTTPLPYGQWINGTKQPIWPLRLAAEPAQLPPWMS